MSKALNFQTTNPAQLVDRVTELQVALQLDESNINSVAAYTAAGAITPGGKAILAAGGTSAEAMTLAAPIPGSQLNGGQDGATMKLVTADAALYTVTAPANSINGNKHIISFGDTTSLAGLGITLTAYNGVWYTEEGATLVGAKADGTVTLQ